MTRPSLNTSDLRKRYHTYSRFPKYRQRVETKIDDHTVATDPISISHIVAIKRPPKPPILAQRNGFNHGNHSRGKWSVLNYSI